MKTLFIGLGGNGVKTAASVRRRLKSYYSYLQQNPALLLNPNLNVSDFDTDEYLFIDTEQAEITKDSSINLATEALILNTNSQSVWDSQTVAHHATGKRFFEWYDEKKAKLNQTSLKDGAGAVRMYGRLGLLAFYTQFESLLKTKLTTLNTIAGAAGGPLQQCACATGRHTAASGAGRASSVS